MEFTQNTSSSNNMSLQVPLACYPGRGISLPVNLTYSSKVWRIGYINSIYSSPSIRRAATEAIYAEHSTSGWTTSLIDEMIDPQTVGGSDADQGPASYPWLTGEVQNTFLDRTFIPHRLQKDTTYYRYYAPTNMIGGGVGYFSETLFTSSSDARRRLALSPLITPNTAEMVVEVTVPAGTIVARGQAAQQNPADLYTWGGSQVVVGKSKRFETKVRHSSTGRLSDTMK